MYLFLCQHCQLAHIGSTSLFFTFPYLFPNLCRENNLTPLTFILLGWIIIFLVTLNYFLAFQFEFIFLDHKRSEMHYLFDSSINTSLTQPEIPHLHSTFAFLWLRHIHGSESPYNQLISHLFLFCRFSLFPGWLTFQSCLIYCNATFFISF